MSSNIPDDVDDDLFLKKRPQDYIFEQKSKTKDRLLNSRALVQESEQIGQSALQELSSQRETLQRAENDLDKINFMTRYTQKNLNHMKSFFGGIRGLFSGGPMPINPPIASIKPSSGVSPSAVAPPALKSIAAPTSSQSNLSSASRPSRVDVNKDDDLEGDLSELGFGLGRLKEMASKLGDEIEDQNEMLDRITSKSERAGDSIKIQNRQINQLLKKS